MVRAGAPDDDRLKELAVLVHEGGADEIAGYVEDARAARPLRI